jgi:LysM repeat protein
LDFRDGVFYWFKCFFTRKVHEAHCFKGETITQIAAHYHIKSSAIYELNRCKRIKFKSVLLIPTIVSKTKYGIRYYHYLYPEKHTVLPKETLYGIAKQYRVTVKDLNKINPFKSG